ncbi:MAG TPA: hypothetical protein VKR59_10860 [Terriglobales bacterium]|nr:hypothetical protein [Terriglobales bacterium]
MSDPEAVSLTLGQVVDLISGARASGANPMVIGMQIFNNLGDDVTLTGSTLTLALATSEIKIDPVLMPLVNAIQTVSKQEEHVDISLNQAIEIQLKVRVKFEHEMSFDVSENGGDLALNNIVGVSGHMGILGTSVNSIQLTQNHGRWSVAVKTPVKTINVELD